MSTLENHRQLIDLQQYFQNSTEQLILIEIVEIWQNS